MRSAVLVISLLAAVAAEAPYHLPRPTFHAPSFSYGQPAPPPPPPPPPPAPPTHFPQLPHPHLQQTFHPPPAPQPNFIQSGYNYAQPIPYPQIQYHQPQIQQPSPQISYNAPSLPISYPRPQQIYHQPIPTYSQPQAQPSFTYAPQFPVEPIRPLPAFLAPQQYSPIAQQFSSGQGYAYQQPQSSSFVSQLPLQSQSFSNFPTSSLSSYQADSNQYNTAAQSQTHSEVLDSTVVNRVQNIIKDNEHTSAKEAGLLSLVSGVSLENARPSVEITSFVQNSAAPNRVIDTSSYSSSSSSSAGASSPSASLLPLFTSNIQPQQQSTGAISLSFLPHTQPATSYGPPN